MLTFTLLYYQKEPKSKMTHQAQRNMYSTQKRFSDLQGGWKESLARESLQLCPLASILHLGHCPH